MWMKEITHPLITGTSEPPRPSSTAIPVFRKQRLDFSSGLIIPGMESE